MKKFPNSNRLKMIFVVTVFSILVSFLVSFVSMSSVYGVYDTGTLELMRARHNAVLAKLSFPFYLETEWGWMETMLNTGTVWFRMFFANVELLEMEFGYRGSKGYVFPHGQTDVNYTVPLFYQLVLMLTALNIIGVPLAAITYKPVTFTYEMTEKLARR